MKAWVLGGHGNPIDVLELRDIDTPSPAPDQLLVRVDATAIAFPDLLRVQGLYQIEQPLGTVPSQECVGRVVAVGSEVGTPVGTRVMGCSDIGNGCLAEFVVMRESMTCPASDDIPLAIAATLQANYVTAYEALHLRAQVRPDEVVVVNGGAGGIGSAAIQLARAAGARVIATDVGESRRQLCLEFGANSAIDTSEQDVVALVNEFSRSGGANVVIDTVGGDVFHACRRCIAPEGRIVIVGFTSGDIPHLKLNSLILRNFTVMGLNSFHYMDRFGELLREVLALWSEGKVAPPVEGEYPFDEAPRLFQRLADREIRGRAVIRVP
jgi:NADPH:quinone reductase